MEEQILKEIKELLEKWLKDRQKLINKGQRAITAERQIELLGKIDQCAEMYNELFHIYKKWLNTDNK